MSKERGGDVAMQKNGRELNIGTVEFPSTFGYILLKTEASVRKVGF